MAHKTSRAAYQKLIERLNKFPQGVVPSEVLYQILRMLFSEKEAEYVSLLPIKPFGAKRAAKLWKISAAKAKNILNALASRGILLDVERDGKSVYTLPPPMAGFFEFSMMRFRKDIDPKALAELFYQYMNVEEAFIKELFADTETPLGRAFVHEPALPDDNSLYVLDYERASEVIRTARYISVGICYCRHKMKHLDRACDAPLEICMTFNTTAESLIKHDIAKAIDAQECLALLEKAYEYDLVQFGENVRNGVNFICNCCGCCCEALIAARKFAFLNPINTTNFLPEVDTERCVGCGKCVEICPVEAMSLVSANDSQHKKQKKARLDDRICLGCGVCVRNCPQDCISLVEREERVITPVNSAHKAVMMAIEKGKLQNLIFDNQAHWNHRAMAAILGVILRLPPAKQLLAKKQVKSRYLEYLLSKR